MTRLAVLRAVSLAIVAALAAAGARAQDKGTDTDPPAEEKAAEQEKPVPQRAERKKPARKKGVLKLDEFTVEGRLHKPTAFFILQRQNLDLEGLDKKETFLPKIVKSVEKDPF